MIEAKGQRSRSGLALGLRSQFETRSVGPRSSIKDSFLVREKNRKAHVACDFDFIADSEGHLKVTVSHVHYKSGGN